MNPVIKIKLKSDIDANTLAHIRAYLADFLHGRFTVELFDGRATLYFTDPRARKLLEGQFPDVIDEISRSY